MRAAADDPLEVVSSPGRVGPPEKAGAGGGGRPAGYPTGERPPPTPDLDPGTKIGVEVGPSRAIGRSGWAPVVPNDEHYPTPHEAPRWCVRVGGIVPRLHRPEHFLMFDPGLPNYRRCPRCGATVYLLPPALGGR